MNKNEIKRQVSENFIRDFLRKPIFKSYLYAMETFNKLKKWLFGSFHFHKWELVSSKTWEIQLLKNLYEANGWSRYKRDDTYKCTKCGERRTETVDSL